MSASARMSMTSARTMTADPSKTGTSNPGRAPARAAAAVAMASLLAGCFFTVSINSEPHAEIYQEAPQSEVYRGDEVIVTASKSRDPDDHRLTVAWSVYACSADLRQCDGPFANASASSVEDRFRFMVPLSRGGEQPVEKVQVVAKVKDERGAETETRLPIVVLNRAPMIAIQPVPLSPPLGRAAYPLGMPVGVVISGSDQEDDALTIAWTCHDPIGVPCGERFAPAADLLSAELAADRTGTWQLAVTATDPAGAQAEQELDIPIGEDGAPCMGTTEPQAVPEGRYIVDHRGAPRRLSVLSVSDDLDTYPPPGGDLAYLGTARFGWQVATPDTGGALAPVAHHDVPEYVLDPSAYAPGDVLRVRVEIDDRQGRSIVCAEQAPTCSITGTGCLQRVTWELEVR